MTENRFIQIGLLTRPHGLKGEVCVDYYADSPFLLKGVVYLRAGKAAPKAYTVKASRIHKEKPLLLFEGIADRTAAETLRGRELLVTKDQLPPLSEDEVYLYELMGLAVHVEGQDTPLGTLEDIQMPGGQELWVIRTPDGREVLFPAAPELVTDIDLDAGIARIAPPEGLLELYLGE